MEFIFSKPLHRGNIYSTFMFNRLLLPFAFCLTFVALSQAESLTDLGSGRYGDVLHIHHAPDPVNVRTGNFYLPVQDYYLPCFSFPLEIYRSCNSVSTRNGPFGKGWNFN